MHKAYTRRNWSSWDEVWKVSKKILWTAKKTNYEQLWKLEVWNRQTMKNIKQRKKERQGLRHLIATGKLEDFGQSCNWSEYQEKDIYNIRIKESHDLRKITKQNRTINAVRQTNWWRSDLYAAYQETHGEENKSHTTLFCMEKKIIYLFTVMSKDTFI